MAQKRVFEYRADDLTVEINGQLMGIVESGVYRGFDAQLDSGLTLKLIHTESGGSYVDETPAVVENVGILRTKQGTVIRETAMVGIEIETNYVGGMGNPRIDLIVCEHYHQDIVDGVQAIYYAIPGTRSATPVAPELTDPAKQMIIGELYLPRNCDSLDDTGVVFTKASLPLNPSMPDTAYPATYDAGTKTITAVSKDRSLYYIYGGVSDEYLEVETIDLFTIDGLGATILSNQKYLIIAGSTKIVMNGTSMITEAFEEIHVSRLGSQFGGEPGSCVVINTGRAYKNKVNKFYKAVITNIGTAGVLSSGQLTFAEFDGNIQRITMAADGELSSISTFAQPDSLAGYNVGMQLIVQITTTKRLTVKHLKSGVSAPYKRIYVYGKNDVILSGNITLFLYEDTDKFYLFQWNADTVIASNNGVNSNHNGCFVGDGNNEFIDAMKSCGVTKRAPGDLLFISEVKAGVLETGQYRYTINIMKATTVDSATVDCTKWLTYTSLVASKKTGWEHCVLTEDDGSGCQGVIVVDWSRLSLTEYDVADYKGGALGAIHHITNWTGGGINPDLPLTTITENAMVDGSSTLYIVEATGTSVEIDLDDILLCAPIIRIKSKVAAPYVTGIRSKDGLLIGGFTDIELAEGNSVEIYKNVDHFEVTGTYTEVVP